MNKKQEQIIAQFIRSLIETKEGFPFDELIKLPEFKDYGFNIKIEVTQFSTLAKSINERYSVENKYNTISALPSGDPCGCCNGSGRAS